MGETCHHRALLKHASHGWQVQTHRGAGFLYITKLLLRYNNVETSSPRGPAWRPPAQPLPVPSPIPDLPLLLDSTDQGLSSLKFRCQD